MVHIQELLESGVHFGHRVTRWNPRMAPFIFGARNGIHIIDLIQTLQYLNETSSFLKDFVSRAHRNSGKIKHVLLVGTKKQASSLVEQMAQTINQEKNAQSDSSPMHIHYVNYRWLGGLLTNWDTMKLCIDQYNDLLVRESSGELQTLPKKEQAVFRKQSEKLQKFFGGMHTMTERPSLVIIIGQDIEMNAVRECQKIQSILELQDSRIQSTTALKAADSKFRTITLLDTNCDPSLADLFVPANDDSTKSIACILTAWTAALQTHA